MHIRMTFGLNGESDKLYASANQAVSEAVSSIRVIQVCVCVCLGGGGAIGGGRQKGQDGRKSQDYVELWPSRA